MSDVLGQALIQTVQWSWLKKSDKTSVFSKIGGNCFLPNKDHVYRTLKNEMLLELMAIQQTSMLSKDELQFILKLIQPFLAVNSNEHSIQLILMRSFMFWLTLNNCLHQIVAKSPSKLPIEFMGKIHILDLNNDDIEQVKAINGKISRELDPLFEKMPKPNDLDHSWHANLQKNKQEAVDVFCISAVVLFALYCVVIGFQQQAHPIANALLCCALLFSGTCLIRLVVKIKEIKFNEFYCKAFMKNFSKNINKQNSFFK